MVFWIGEKSQRIITMGQTTFADCRGTRVG